MMALRIVSVGARDFPRVFCDWCEEGITEAGDGNYQWPIGGGQVYYTHKRCCHAFESAMPDVAWGAMGLECLPVYLGGGLNVKWPEARKTAAFLASV